MFKNQVVWFVFNALWLSKSRDNHTRKYNILYTRAGEPLVFGHLEPEPEPEPEPVPLEKKQEPELELLQRKTHELDCKSYAAPI